MILRVNQGYSGRTHVTNHNSDWRNCKYTAPLQMDMLQEITISNVIGKYANPFITIAKGFGSYQILKYRYVKIPVQMGVTEEITRFKVIGQATNQFIHVAEDFIQYPVLECGYVAIPVQMDVTEEITRSKVIGMPINPFACIAEDFVLFIRRYSDYFTVSTRSVATQAEQYLCGLMQSDKRNMERMEEVVPDSNEQSFQNFISNSPWDACAILQHICRDADSLFGGDPDICRNH
ncbi:MAG: transposase [Euryarchaeota archaeon]|nr:transposase [Euryarchaeota archaeon]